MVCNVPMYHKLSHHYMWKECHQPVGIDNSIYLLNHNKNKITGLYADILDNINGCLRLLTCTIYILLHHSLFRND